MQITLTTKPGVELDAGALVVVCHSDQTVDEKLAGGLARELRESGEFKAKALEKLMIHRPAGLPASRLLLIGAGEQAKFTPAVMRRVGGVAVRELQSRGATSCAITINDAEMLEAFIEGACEGSYEPDTHKTERENGASPLEHIQVSVQEVTPELEAARSRAEAVAGAQNWTRALVAEPGNLLTPGVLAAKAREMAAEAGLECEVLQEQQLRELGCGALLGVAQGSAEPPLMIVVKYRPAQESATHLALVGKGVTFDSGGISIKPSADMDKMRYDMAGAAAVLGAMRALAALKPAIAVTAFAPCVENMPGSRAQRPGDIVTSYLGKTIEVLNTDAEGRLILADALTYAVRQGCTHLVDAATLTGAIAVALGHLRAGVFSNDKPLEQRLLNASEAAGEPMWPFPMDDEYSELLKSPFADLANIGGRWGGSISAAKFLEEFVESKPWAHLDIAGTAWLEETKPYLAKGPTGLPLRTLVRLALNW